MPKVVTTVNLDFDEKEEFIKKFGKAELSEFLRHAIHEKLQEKNREAGIDLSAIRRHADIIPKHEEVNQSLDRFMQYIKDENTLQPILTMYPKSRQLFELLNTKSRTLQRRR